MKDRGKPLAGGSYDFEGPPPMTVAWATWALEAETMRHPVAILATFDGNEVRAEFGIDAIAMARIDKSEWPRKVLELAQRAVREAAANQARKH